MALGLHKGKSVIGEKYNKLLIQSVYKDEKSIVRAVCLCDCGKIKHINLETIKQNTTKSCSCYRRKIMVHHTEKKRALIRLAYGEAAFNAVCRKYKSHAKNAKREFNLDRNQLKILFESSCYYCDATPANVFKGSGMNGDYTYNGIDRKDNSLGYTIQNCITCCKQCNFAKGFQSFEDFVLFLKRVSKKWHSAREGN